MTLLEYLEQIEKCARGECSVIPGETLKDFRIKARETSEQSYENLVDDPKRKRSKSTMFRRMFFHGATYGYRKTDPTTTLKLVEIIRELVGAVEFYGDDANYEYDYTPDDGPHINANEQKAQQALERAQKILEGVCDD